VELATGDGVREVAEGAGHLVHVAEEHVAHLRGGERQREGEGSTSMAMKPHMGGRAGS